MLICKENIQLEEGIILETVTDATMEWRTEIHPAHPSR